MGSGETQEVLDPPKMPKKSKSSVLQKMKDECGKSWVLSPSTKPLAMDLWTYIMQVVYTQRIVPSKANSDHKLKLV